MALYAIGDVQGCDAALAALLARSCAFRPSRDRLWLVGDLVNRGPDSLGVLRRVMALGRSVTCVLGNHDLHLLATVAGKREISPADTFGAVLAAPDADEIVNWLRHRPLMHYDARTKHVLVHAGLPPGLDRRSSARASARRRDAAARAELARRAAHDVRQRAVRVDPQARSRRATALHDQRAHADALLRQARAARSARVRTAGLAAEGARAVVRRARATLARRAHRVRPLGRARPRAPRGRHGPRQRLRLGQLPHGRAARQARTAHQDRLHRDDPGSGHAASAARLPPLPPSFRHNARPRSRPSGADPARRRWPR